MLFGPKPWAVPKLALFVRLCKSSLVSVVLSSRPLHIYILAWGGAEQKSRLQATEAEDIGQTVTDFEEGNDHLPKFASVSLAQNPAGLGRCLRHRRRIYPDSVCRILRFRSDQSPMYSYVPWNQYGAPSDDAAENIRKGGKQIVGERTQEKVDQSFLWNSRLHRRPCRAFGIGQAALSRDELREI